MLACTMCAAGLVGLGGSCLLLRVRSRLRRQDGSGARSGRHLLGSPRSEDEGDPAAHVSLNAASVAG